LGQLDLAPPKRERERDTKAHFAVFVKASCRQTGKLRSFLGNQLYVPRREYTFELAFGTPNFRLTQGQGRKVAGLPLQHPSLFSLPGTHQIHEVEYVGTQTHSFLI